MKIQNTLSRLEAKSQRFHLREGIRDYRRHNSSIYEKKHNIQSKTY
jgi:hypothetical protein